MLPLPSLANQELAQRAHRFRPMPLAIGAVLALAGLLLPMLVLSPDITGASTQTFRATMVDIALFSIAALGLNVLVGYCGLLNLGFAGFMCIGAYTSAILTREFGWNYVPACLMAAAHAALWGIILGLPTLHLTGDYFAIVTFGFAELVLLSARNNIFGLTKGTAGYPGVPPATLDLSFLQKLGLFASWPAEKFVLLKAQVGDKRVDYYIAAAWLILVVLVIKRLATSRLGRAWRAIQADELAAQSVGIDTRWYKTQAFAVAAALGGLAGAIQAAHLQNVAWNNFTFLVSVYILVYVVLGGMGTVGGVILGTAIMVSLLEVLRYFLKEVLPVTFPVIKGWVFLEDLRLLIYGFILVVFIRFRPEGLVPSTAVARELHPNDLERHHHDVGYDSIVKERRSAEP